MVVRKLFHYEVRIGRTLLGATMFVGIKPLNAGLGKRGERL